MNLVEQIRTKYWALEILTSGNHDDVNSLSHSLTTSCIDMNPHQIQAALFALKSSLSQGVILADEVGLGKTIEAGIVLSEYFAQGKGALLVIAPAALCPQWQIEMKEKFDLPARILDRKIYDDLIAQNINPLDFKGIVICSYHFAARMKKEMGDVLWDLVVFDEAHKLRNLQNGKTMLAEAMYQTFSGHKKLLLTATPIQNSLLDIYSLVSMIDTSILGNKDSFIQSYINSERKYGELKKRLECVLHRTLRKDVLEYIRYTNREAITIAFNPTKAEEDLYLLVSDYIQDRSQFAITTNVRTLIVLMIRKLMGSSTSAVKGTLVRLRDRLILQNQQGSLSATEIMDLFPDMPFLENCEEDFDGLSFETKKLDKGELEDEIKYINLLIEKADAIQVDAKTTCLIDGLKQGFEKMVENKALRKAIIFTESQRTLEYLYDFLSENGFKDKIVTYSGSNTSSLCQKNYENYALNHPDELTGSKTTDMKKAIVTAFKDDAEIMIATEAAAEGLNLQFCSLLVNYDLPWNPQRIEQRIGRVHRYGQKNDVVIINFVNKRNIADVRIYEILKNKFKLFDGVFGASDEILGSLSDGVDFEKAIDSIFEHCRTVEEIERAFDELQASVGEKRDEELEKTKQLVLENLAPTLQEKLRGIKKNVDDYLARSKVIFWELTKNILRKKHPDFFINEISHQFGKLENFKETADKKVEDNLSYQLDYTKNDTSFLIENEAVSLKTHLQPYNPSSVLGRQILNEALSIETPDGKHLIIQGTKIPKGQKGRIIVTKYTIENPQAHQYLIATAIDSKGGKIRFDISDLFDHIVDVQNDSDIRFKDFLATLHQETLDKFTKEKRRETETQIRTMVEQLNRWAFDEKEGLKFGVKNAKNKINSLKRQMKSEKDFDKKVAYNQEIQVLKQRIRDEDNNIFDLERQIEKKANASILAKKRQLQYRFATEEMFNYSFEVISP